MIVIASANDKSTEHRSLGVPASLASAFGVLAIAAALNAGFWHLN